ncbi:SDR family NAD(P)-dependent oxidoreductase [Natrarchaeobius chitinivorans]|uniref:Glucose 1-dehydrogenase n=1 Tax=Natrarchaeobius chitinivorans TaxID=1679083 RepID=A0A3N6MBJ5_NATCH|nr:glucose 1-dehydrogenase [Natrarchaeobius chitinivorans]RQG91026.1 glucose 1-dehydrogenase [Natrarchaeobius chitinivorans]
MTRFDETTAVVTGSGSGIGRKTARTLAEDGSDVVVADIDRENGEEAATTIANETDADATFVEVDVTDDADVERMVETAVSEYGDLDVAVNNAGLGSKLEPTADVSEDDWQRIIDVNLTGVWRCLRVEIDAMLEDGGGAIVNTASILGRVGTEGAPAYTASKHGVVGLTKVAALDYASEDVRVNAVCPGYIETPMLEEAGLYEDEETVDQLRELHPQGRLGEPQEIADAIAWLCSDEASFATGEAMAIDGGYLSR